MWWRWWQQQKRFIRMLKIRLNGRFGIYDVIFNANATRHQIQYITIKKSIWQKRMAGQGDGRRPTNDENKMEKIKNEGKKMFFWPEHKCRAECELLYIPFDVSNENWSVSCRVYFEFLSPRASSTFTSACALCASYSFRMTRNLDIPWMCIVCCRLPHRWMCKWQTHAHTQHTAHIE